MKEKKNHKGSFSSTTKRLRHSNNKPFGQNGMLKMCYKTETSHKKCVLFFAHPLLQQRLANGDLPNTFCHNEFSYCIVIKTTTRK